MLHRAKVKFSTHKQVLSHRTTRRCIFPMTAALLSLDLGWRAAGKEVPSSLCACSLGRGVLDCQLNFP
jgi:hypothetical protein